ncbi:AAA family ATPase [Actinomadura sp. K4S16]|uniref:ATP-binding protein n=1 Tax=Actinomadura sp. K4S16 TaxID=1316147 RepID=UPI0011EF039F|nr:AAA family ATPase [Actinomadura sp. K4S16]
MVKRAGREAVEVALLGRFEVRVAGDPVPAAAWSRRHAAALVKMLSLAPRRRMHREQVMDALWPDVPVHEAAPRLHKAAHFARRVLGTGSLVLRAESVMLFPDVEIDIDVLRFQELAAKALQEGDQAAASEAADAYRGPLLPEDPYEPWADEPRDRLHSEYLRMLRQARRWAELAEQDPADTEAHLELMRRHAGLGDRRAALRQFERMDRALHRELGVGPSDEAIALRNSLVETAGPPGGPAPSARTALVGRAASTATLEGLLAEAGRDRGLGRTVFISGAPGMGKSTLAEWMRGRAAASGWRVGHGVAAPIEGAWAYAPVLEALADLCRHHPTLLDGLDDRCREDIDRALSGRVLDWDGDGSHQRLFVAVAELVRLAAAGTGVLLTVDDVHEADDASLRLLHYLSRSCLSERLILVLTHRRQPITEAFENVRASLLGRTAAIEVALAPLDRAETAELVAACRPDAPGGLVEHIWDVSGGVPFPIVELARTAGLSRDGGAEGEPMPGDAVLAVLSPRLRTALEPVATAGSTFDTDEFIALCGLPDEDEAFDCLDAALAALVVERTLGGYRFRHRLIRDALLAGIPPHRERALHRACARRLAAMGSSPARVGHHLLAAGEHRAAVPYVLRAAETQAAVGAYRDALSLVDSVRSVAEGADLARVLALRAELLGAVGDPAAISAFRQAVAAAPEAARRPLRARMALTAVYLHDLDTAGAVLAGLEAPAADGEQTGGDGRDQRDANATIMLIKGYLAYFGGDLDAAWEAVSTADRLSAADSAGWRQLDMIALKGLITHNRGEWDQLMRLELMRTRQDPGLTTAVFDSHLCVVEFLLYGPTPYSEVIEFARTLRTTAERAGALRAVAFAGTVIGEAALLHGDLGLALCELTDAVDLHRELGATMGEAHSLQRLAEVRLALGDRAEAGRLLRRALPLARWAPLAMHLLQRVYGTMVAAEEDPEAARAVVDAAEASLAHTDFCPFCAVMFEVPSAIACTRAGDLAEARRHLERAELSAAMWEGTAWQAAMLEARAHLARAEGAADEAAELLSRAAAMFEEASQPLDAARCRAGIPEAV